MSEYEKQKIESELKVFTSRHFLRPADCKNLEQLRFYIGELCLKINELRTRFDYVPGSAYTLLAQYNAKQNTMLYRDFVDTY